MDEQNKEIEVVIEAIKPVSDEWDVFGDHSISSF